MTEQQSVAPRLFSTTDLVDKQTRTLFRYYNYYRLIISLLLIAICTLRPDFLQSDFRLPAWFQTTAFAFFSLNLLALLWQRFSSSLRYIALFVSIITDITVLHLFMYSSAGISGGMSNLVIITVAAGNILLNNRLGLVFAAFAALLSISIEIEYVLAGLSPVTNTVKAGLAGSIYFAAAFILQNISRRIINSEQLASQRAQDLFDLEKLNHQIIQRMRTGIVVTDKTQRIRLCNQAATDMLQVEQGDSLPAPLQERYQMWQDNPDLRTTPFQMQVKHPLVQANFTRLPHTENDEVLIFIEDTRQMTQQAQQLKLASLGRLTASIAHEIRNPLGAISHATQLLAESENLGRDDLKLIDIVQRHSIRMNSIIENTLQLSRRQQPAAEEVGLKNWLQKVIETYSHEHPNKREIDFEVANEDANARFDPDQIEQVLVNLFDNGLRYSEKHTGRAHIKVRLGVTRHGQQAFIEVIDDGAGISEEDALHLFEPFFTTDSQGTGLGLYLSRELCESNQAQLAHITPYNPGTCFRITFAHFKKII